jgi:hypothetical protein
MDSELEQALDPVRRPGRAARRRSPAARPRARAADPHRARVEEDEFRAARIAASGDVEACADRLGITTRSVFRLRSRFGV